MNLSDNQTVLNPSATVTRPADTAAYAQNDLVASSTTAGSVLGVGLLAAAPGCAMIIPRVRISTNKTSGWDGAVIRVRLWSAAPTYTNGDNGAYAVATGGAGLLGMFDVTLSQFTDGASGAGVPTIGTALWVRLPVTSAQIFWDMQYTSAAALTPASGQTFTLSLEALA